MSTTAKRVDRHVGDRIRQRRVALGMTQEDLAGALHISYQQVQKYETGANRVSAGRLYEIARRLGEDAGYFFADFDDDQRPAVAEHGGRKRSVIEVAHHFEKIDKPSVRAALVGLIKTVAR